MTLTRLSIDLFRLRAMLTLRSLLDTLGAVAGDAEQHIHTVRAMFPPPGSAGNSAAARHASSPAARTAAFVRRQMSIRQRLWEMSEGYSTSDARTVRSVDVSQLDELYDIVQEACSTKLFSLRAATGQGSAAQYAPHDEDEHVSQRGVDERVEDGRKTTSSIDMSGAHHIGDNDGATLPIPRRLLMDALLNKLAVAELRYFVQKLPADMHTELASMIGGLGRR